MEAADEKELAEKSDPPCPKCRAKARKRRGLDMNGRAPAVGGSLVVRAVDTTAEIVMEDHGMTNLRDDAREGESMAPKLPPAQQAMADNFFKRPTRRGNAPGIFGMSNQSIINAAVNGRFKTADTVDPVATQHRAKERPPIRIVAGDGVKPGR